VENHGVGLLLDSDESSVTNSGVGKMGWSYLVGL